MTYLSRRDLMEYLEILDAIQFGDAIEVYENGEWRDAEPNEFSETNPSINSDCTYRVKQGGFTCNSTD